MRAILISLLAIGLFFLSTTAEGADWELVSIGDSSGNSWFVDKESIRHVSEAVVRAWIKLVHTKPEPENSKFRTFMLGYDEHNCNEKKYRSLQLVRYYTDGTHYSISNPHPEDPREWNNIVHDTVFDSIHNYLCKGKK